MHDILPPTHQARGKIRPQSRLNPPTGRSEDVYKSLYAGHPRVINISTNTVGSTIITEQVTEIRPPTPKEERELLEPVSLVVKELPVQEKVSVMIRALEVARKDLERERRKKSFFKRLALTLVAGVLLLSTGYVGVDTWLTNSRLEASAEAPAPAPTSSADATKAPTKPESTGTFGGDVDKTAPVASALSTYRVAPDAPRALYISSLKIAARIQPMNLNGDKSLQAPKNIYDSGWYTGSSKPGQSGAMVMDGHASETGTHYGLFGYLDRIKEGDNITIEKGDGTKLQYAVVHVETDALADVDMNKVMVPYNGAAQGLNIITCTGKWTSDNSTLDHRLIVFAVPQ